MTVSLARHRVFESSTLPSVVMDPETCLFLDCNPAAAQMYGFGSIDATLGKTPIDVSAPVQYDGSPSVRRVREYIDRALTDGSVVFEWCHQRPDGQKWDAEVHLVRFVDDEKVLPQFTLIDITKRKQALQALRESEVKYRFLTESMKDVVWTVDVKTLRFLYVSPSVERLRGYTPEEVMAEPMDAALTPDAAVQLHQMMAAYVARFEAGKIEDLKDTFFTDEVPQPCKDGSIVWTEVITSYSRNPTTGCVELHGVTRDITARKRTEAKLRESESRFRVLFEQAGLAIVVLNQEEVFVECNQQALEVFGCTSAALVGAFPWDFSPRTQPDGLDSKQSARAKIQAALESGPQFFEWTHKRLDQTIFPAEVALSAVHAENEVLVFGIIRDITERKRAEQESENLQAQFLQSQKMEAVGRLAGGVAHDFNNLLGVIIGRADLLLGDLPQDHPFREDLDSILEAANRSAGLTKQLLTFARKQTVAPHSIDLNSAVEGTLKMLRRLIGEDVELVWKPGEASAEVMMDPSQLDQVLANLCVNARDAIRGVGKVIIETANTEFDEAYCATQADLVPGAYVVLALSDSGSGMPEEVLKHIFDPFFTTKPLGKGTGLGLSTVYGIIRQNRGAIRVHSSPGMGTTFKIFLPRTKSATTLVRTTVPVACGRCSGETLLLVEDEPALCALIHSMLERFGFKVLSTCRPSLAVEIARAHDEEIALLITDVIMPEMNGRELFTTLANFRSKLKCLYLSGYTADIIAYHGVLDDGTAFLSKPFTANALAAKIFEVLA